MPLEKFIDLIAEVAAKRIAQSGKREEKTPDAVLGFWLRIRAALRRVHGIFAQPA